MPSILLIDDDDSLRETLANALTRTGYDVRQARDGDQGLEIFRVEPTDLVITDLVMPNQEGIETIEKLRRANPNLGIIAMSGGLARNAPLYLKLASALGASHTLQKPFDLPTLLAAIEKVLAGADENRPPGQAGPSA